MRDLRQGDLGQRWYRDTPLPSPLSVWFWAAFLMATHSNGMSAMQLKSELGLGSYHTAWLLAMSDLERRAITMWQSAEYFIESAAKGYQRPKATLLQPAGRLIWTM